MSDEPATMGAASVRAETGAGKEAGSYAALGPEAVPVAMEVTGVARASGRAALEGATPLAGNAHKLPLIETLVRRAILRAVARA